MVPKIYLCPSDKRYACSWEGPSEDILEHFNEEHEELLSFSNIITVDVGISSENKLVFFDEEIYLLQAKTDNENLYIFLRYLGPEKIASKITYDIAIECGDKKLDNRWVTVRCGYFAINLECLKLHLGEENVLSCVLSVSGDFTSITSEEECPIEYVNLHKDEIGDNEGRANIEHSAKSQIDTSKQNIFQNGGGFYYPSPTDSGVSLLDSINTSDDDPLLHLQLKRQGSLDDSKRRSFENLSVLFGDGFNEPNLIRSNTFNFEDIRRKTPARRNPSTASLESIKEDDSNPELLCTNCECVMNPPIFLCISGHNFCSACGKAKNVCAICDEKITEERNLDLEEKSISHLYPCRNRKLGCSKKLPYMEIKKHEINCKYCLYKCPMEGCGYNGQFKSMHHHLKLIHSSTKLLDTFIVGFQKQNDAFLANEDKGIFYCSVIVLNDSVLWEAKFCGPKEREFFCELKFKERNLKIPHLLKKVGDTYRIEIPFQDLKKMKVKSKNAFITITR